MALLFTPTFVSNILFYLLEYELKIMAKCFRSMQILVINPFIVTAIIVEIHLIFRELKNIAISFYLLFI